MKISLVTVSYNAAATIADTMESVRRQRLPEGVSLEYIIVDGASTDGTAAKICECAEQVEAGGDGLTFKWISEKDQGLYDAMNKGIRMATGDIVGILNADDWLEDENVLGDVVKGFESGVDAIYGDVRFVKGEEKETVRYYSSRRWRPWMHNWGFMPAHPSVYVRREVFEKFGYYKLGYKISADFEWMTRIFCRGKIKARYLPRCMVTMRLGGASTAGLKAMLKLNRENVRANRENGYFCCLPMMLPKYLFKIWGVILPRIGWGRG